MDERILQEIKERLDIIDFISNYVELKKVGSYYRGLCPFHQERNPSFFVSPERQIFKCFGCGAVGDVITFYMKIENLTFKEAVEKLAEKLGIEIQKAEADDVSFHEIKRLLEINQIAVNFFKKNLQESNEVINYLLKRGLNLETINYFDIGYAKEGNYLRDFLFSLGYSIEEIQKAGLLNEKREDKFKSRIMFPLIDISGRIVGFTGRIFPEKEMAPKYLNSPETLLFKKSKFIYGLIYSKDYIVKEKEVILVEGQFDFLLSFQNKLKNCVAISGSSLTKQQLQILKKYTNKIVIGFDNDIAGFKASIRAGLMALEMGFDLYKLIFGKYKDLAEFFEDNNTIEKLSKLSFIDFLFDYIQNNYDLNNLDHKKAILDLILPFIKFLDIASASLYIKKLSSLLEIKEEFILSEIQKLQAITNSIENEYEYQSNRVVLEKNKIIELFERYIAISKLLNKPESLEILKQEINDVFADYLEEILNNSESEDLINIRMFYEKISNADLEREFNLIKREILKEYYKNKINYYKELVDNLNLKDNRNLEELLKQVKFYTERLKNIERNG